MNSSLCAQLSNPALNPIEFDGIQKLGFNPVEFDEFKKALL